MHKIHLNLSANALALLKDYACWVVKVWDEPKEGYNLRDHAIMALGLCGESSEVVETTLATNHGDANTLKRNITKELGDCLYYAVILAMAQGYEFHTAISSNEVCYELKDLPYFSGFIAEKYKKEIRKSTELNSVNIASSLEIYLNVLIFCCEQYTDGFIGVMHENQVKLNDRLSRNVLIGEGNDR